MAKLIPSYKNPDSSNRPSEESQKRVFQEFIDELRDKLEGEVEKKENCELKIDGYEEQKTKREEAWDRARNLFNEYYRIQKEIGIPVSQHKANLLETNENGPPSGAVIDLKKLMADLKDQLEITHTCFQDTDKKVKEVGKAFDQLDEAICDKANAADVDALNREIQFSSRVEEVRKRIVEINQEANKNMQGVKKALLINAPMKSDPIETGIDQLAKLIEEFVSNIETNLKESSEQVETYRTALEELYRNLKKQVLKCRIIGNKIVGHEHVLDFAGPEESRTSKVDLDGLMEAFKKKLMHFNKDSSSDQE